MNKERKALIEHQILKLKIRKELSLRDISDAKRQIGNIAKEPEMTSENISKEEVLEVGKALIREVLKSQMDRI